MIYFIRHAKSVLNEQRIYAGNKLDTELSVAGLESLQSMVFINQFRNIKIDIIYSSSLLRSIKTAEIIAQITNTKMIADDRINELDFGDLTGKNYLKTPISNLQKDDALNIESPNVFYDRINSFYKGIDKNIDVLIVSHAGVGKMLFAIINDIEFYFYNDCVEFKNLKIIELCA